MLIHDEQIRAIEDGNEQYRIFTGQYKLARMDAAKKVRDAIQSSGLNLVSTAAILDCDVGLLHRSVMKQFGLTPEATVKLCYSFLDCSCHSLYSDSPAVTILPRRLSLLASTFRGAKANERAKYSSYVMNALTEEHQNGTWEIQTWETLIGSRLREMANDRGVYAANLCGKSAYTNIKTSLTYHASVDKTDAAKLRQSGILYFAVATGTTMDYFLVQDYTAQTDICLFWDKDRKPIQEKAVRFFIGKFLMLSPENQAKVMSQILHDAALK